MIIRLGQVVAHDNSKSFVLPRKLFRDTAVQNSETKHRMQKVSEAADRSAVFT